MALAVALLCSSLVVGPQLRVPRVGVRMCEADCYAHGACDLRDGVCACDAPWAGRRCELERAPPPPYPLLRRAIKVALFFAVAAVVGALVGYARQRARHRYEESLLAAASGGGEKA